MRIVAGKFRSRPLQAPKGRKTRPTSDRLRETLFNVLAPKIAGAVFADLFAGTGSVGIEALSRGARQVFFAENTREALTTLRANLEKFGIGPEAQLEPSGTATLLRGLMQRGICLDIAFLDPPYGDESAYKTTLKFLAEQPILNPQAIVIVEHARRSPPIGPERLQAYRVIDQGDSSLTFFHCNNSANEKIPGERRISS